MNGFFDKVLSQLEAGLDSAAAESNLIRRYDRCLTLVKAAIAELKQALQANPFSGKEDEICTCLSFGSGSERPSILNS
jgi:hypothetical protein